jgi:peroxiredoxin
MAAIFILLVSTTLPAQTPTPQVPPSPRYAPARSPAPVADTILTPRLSRGQELVYHGTYSEEGRDGGVQFDRSFRMETRLLVLDTPPKGAEVAVMTLLKHRAAAGSVSAEGASVPLSVRLERAFVDLQGNVLAAEKVDWKVPLDTAPTLESGFIVSMPAGRLRSKQEWTSLEEDRPGIVWRVAGNDMAAGYSCIKLIGEQKSEDWDRPRGDRAAWRRVETVWLAPSLGLACRLEREIFHREPAQREATRKSRLYLELESSLQMAGRGGDGRRREVVQTLAFRDALTPLLENPARCGPQCAALLRRIDQFLADQPETAYRPALLQVKRRVEAAQRGETPPAPVSDFRPVATGSALNQRAPDFIASNFSGGSAQLRRWMGKPVVLVFYHPSSRTAAHVLRFAQQLQTRYSGQIVVAGLSISDDGDLIRRQQAELGVKFPILSGGGMRASFGVVSTPKIVLLDSNNVIRGEYLGWAWGDTAREVENELKKWLKTSPEPASPAPARAP